jgi:(2Fe-2S) ferredoxin
VQKHPDVDHAEQEAVLREAAAVGGGKLIRTRCLDVCERSNVIVVKAERDTYWFGEVLRPDQLQRVAAFVCGAAPPPIELAFRKAPRRHK